MKKENSFEIDILALAISVLKEWKILMIVGVVGAVVGVIYALNNPKMYTVEVNLAPEYQSDSMAILPSVYPSVIKGNDFVNEMRKIPVRTKEGLVEPYEIHLMHYKMPFWQRPKAWLVLMTQPKDVPVAESFSGAGMVDPYHTNLVDEELQKAIEDLVVCSSDIKTDILTISVTDQDPMVAAIVADSAQSKLQHYIKVYKTQKARMDYEFYEKRCIQTKTEYNNACQEYSAYAEAYMHTTLPSCQVKKEELKSEMHTRYEAYEHAERQRTKAEARIMEDTPAFVLMNHPVMPYKASSRARWKQVLIWIFLFEMIATLIIAYKKS